MTHRNKKAAVSRETIRRRLPETRFRLHLAYVRVFAQATYAAVFHVKRPQRGGIPAMVGTGYSNGLNTNPVSSLG